MWSPALLYMFIRALPRIRFKVMYFNGLNYPCCAACAFDGNKHLTDLHLDKNMGQGKYRSQQRSPLLLVESQRCFALIGREVLVIALPALGTPDLGTSERIAKPITAERYYHVKSLNP